MDLFGFLARYWPQFLLGAWITIQLAFSITVVSVVIGLMTALARNSRFRVFRLIATFYVEVIRALPPLLLLFAVYFILPDTGIYLDAFTSAVIALGSYAGGFTCEIFRGGIAAVHKGQFEAGLSLGLNIRQLYWKVILPQALRISLPALANQIILNVKATSLAVTITVPEIMFVASAGASNTFRPAEFYAIAGIFYLAMILPLSRLARKIERTPEAKGSQLARKKAKQLARISE
jgi:His/Glu/Gln/Arg/opine family amino acid ABC transporter permease subunit